MGRTIRTSRPFYRVLVLAAAAGSPTLSGCRTAEPVTVHPRPNLQPGSQSPAVPAIFSSGFDNDAALTAIGPITRRANHAIVPDPDDPANHALRVAVDEGEHYGGSFTIDLADHMENEPTRLYFRYRIRFDASWAPTSTGKLPGFGGTYGRAGWGGRPADGRNGWSARGEFGPPDEHGRIPIGSYVYHADMVERGQTYGNGNWWDAALERERWYVIEQEIQLDTVTTADGVSVGQADGWLRAWVDGRLVLDRQGLHLRDSEDLAIETVWANVYHGGKTPAPADMSLLIDDVWVGSTRPSDPTP